MTNKNQLIGATAALLSTGMANAALTYVDADFATNTTPGSAVTTLLAADTLWGERSGFGTNNTIFEVSGNSGAEDAVEIATTITGLTPFHLYDVWVNFYDPLGSTENWNIRAGLTTGDTTLFANDAVGSFPFTTPVTASTLDYDSPVPKFDDGGSRILRAGALGPTAADASGNIVVYIDDAPASIASNNRTWYDGVSYQFNSVPEPSATLLGAFGIIGLLRRRR